MASFLQEATPALKALFCPKIEKRLAPHITKGPASDSPADFHQLGGSHNEQCTKAYMPCS